MTKTKLIDTLMKANHQIEHAMKLYSCLICDLIDELHFESAFAVLSIMYELENHAGIRFESQEEAIVRYDWKEANQ